MRACCVLFISLFLAHFVLCNRPNVLLFIADDLGYGDLSYISANNPRQVANSTFIDTLARKGARLDQAYTAEAVCTPSRTALLTGRYSIRAGMASSDPDFRTMMSPAQKTGLQAVEFTLAEALKQIGYKTVLLGKWHLGVGGTGEYLPSSHGFDYYYGMPVSNVETCGGKKIYKEEFLLVFAFYRTWNVWVSMAAVVIVARFFGLIGNFTTVLGLSFVLFMIVVLYWFTANFTLCAPMSCVLYRNYDVVEQPVVLQNLTLRLTHEALDFLGSHKKTSPEQPFFLMMSFIKVHTALFTSDLFTNRSIAGEFGDNVEEMDWSVGKIMDSLEENGYLNNTLVIFTSDNGPYLETGMDGGSSGYVIDENGKQVALKGGKGQNWEGGIRVPTIMYWNDKISPKLIKEPTSLMDFYPTILKVAEHPGVNVTFDGKDLTSLIFSEEKAPVENIHEFLFHWCGRIVHAVRYKEWKMHWITPVWDEGTDHCGSIVICQCVGRHMTYHVEPLLFNMTADPGENHPIDTKLPIYKEIRELLSQAKDEHMKSIVPVPNQLESLPRPWLMPCCNPKGDCTCVEDDTRFEYLLSDPEILPSPLWRS